jgi:hypothetical protein
MAAPVKNLVQQKQQKQRTCEFDQSGILLYMNALT